jgi:hypothetical protein
MLVGCMERSLRLANVSRSAAPLDLVIPTDTAKTTLAGVMGGPRLGL